MPQLTRSRTAYIKLWNYKSSRYCPECLKESPVWRLEWESIYFTACPTHGCQLVDTCGVCGEQLTWKRKKLMSCDCGALLRVEPINAIEPEIALAKSIREKIYGERCSLNLVRFLSYEQLCHLAHVLGVYSDPEEERASQKVINLASLGVAQKLTKAASELLADWPAAFYQMLDNLMSLRSAQAGETSLVKQYGYFYSYVFNRMKAKEFRFIQEAFERHIVRSWIYPLNRRNRRISVQGRSSGIWVPLDFAVQQLGTTHNQLKLLFDAGQISASARTLESGRRSICLDRDELPVIKELLDDMVDQQIACSILNIKKSRMLQLLKGRLVGVYMSPQKGGGKWGVSLKSLREILAIGKGLPSPESVSLAAGIRMDQVLQFWLQHESLFSALIQAVKNRQILPVAVSPELPGIQGWVFDEDRLKQWRNEQIQSIRNGAMTITQAAEKLKVKQEAIYHFVKMGVLKTSKIGDHQGVALITKEELQRFTENYALSREFAELINTSASQVTRMLKRHGIKPVCGKEIDGCTLYLYQRAMALDNAIRKINSQEA
ncbi:MAG: TniQ family protein [Gallionella sp.]|nr:TniQ family protein [Gallionella sp.]